ncbi:MAG: CDP-alcohol phosphatidyltransferase family protein [Ignavibacteriales bacterium]|nr:CDP-alcohol phosphatidyltransferase family protein [Ignavibacteriales bacterium]
MSWLQEYKSSLKLIEVEELFDLIFYRPLAFIFVKIIYSTNLTPNQITTLALIIGMIGGVVISFNTYSYLIIAAILLIIYDVLDCSDGQLARLKKNGTPAGRILDGVADYFVTISVYLGIGFGFANDSNNPVFYWVLLVLAGASNIVHAIALDYYRNRFLDYATNRESLLGDDLKEFEDEYKTLRAHGGNYFQLFILWIYLKYSNLQLKASKNSSETIQKKYDSKDFYKKNKTIMHLWTYIGPTSELTFIIFTALINRLDIYLIGMITFVNIYAIILFFVQHKIDGSTKLAEIK